MEKRTVFFLSVIFVLITSTMSFAEKKASNFADMILYNGNIYTVDKEFSKASAVAIKDGRFFAVGGKDDVTRYEGPGTEKIDLKGSCVIPGLMDAHIHFDPLGKRFVPSSSKPKTNVKAWLDAVAEKVAKSKPGEWIHMPYPWGLDKKLSAKVIDTVAPNNPIHFSTAPHRGIVNSMALKIMGIRKGVKIDGGDFEVDENGNPTGHLYGYANAKGTQYYGGTAFETVEEFKNRIRGAMREVNKVGLTSIYQQAADPKAIRAYRELADAGESTVRVRADVWQMLHDFIPLEEIEKNLAKLMFVTPQGLGDEWFKIGGIKTLYDAPLSMYDFEDMRHGSLQSLKQLAITAAKYKMRLTVHAHGDRAIDDYLDACEYAHSKYPIDKMRWIAIHHSFPTPDDYPRIKKLGLVVSAQPLFIHSKWITKYIKDDPKPPHLEIISHPFKSELEAGIKIGFGSDSTLQTYDPIVGMYAAITRKSPHPGERGFVINGKEGLTRRQALECYTINNAYLLFEEDIKGSIEPGKLADLVVLTEDIMTCPVENLHKNINIDMTMVGGKIVYKHEAGKKYKRRPYWRF